MKNIDHNNSRFTMLLNTIGRSLAILILILGSALCCHAQLTPFQSGYFQNRYILNPAMAGLEKGVDINLNYRQQMNSFPGAPKEQSFTAEYFATDRVGLGLNVNNDQAGLLKQTRIMGTYAYHIPLNEAGKLSFGLSLGVSSPSLNYANVNGDQSDVQIANYNQMKTYVDGDFGVAYTSHNLSVEAAIPNLKTVLFGSQADQADIDRTVFFTSARYKITLDKEEGNFTLEPLVVFRNVKGYSDIVDAGANLTMTSYNLSLEAFYHSSRSVGFGVGVGPKLVKINLAYDLQTGPIQTYTTGGFELGLKVKL